MYPRSRRKGIWFCLPLIWLFLLLLADAGTANQVEGLLFRLEREGADPSYVFGTIHSEDPRVTRLPLAVQEAFEASRVLLAETVMDVENARRSMDLLRLPGGTELRSLIGPRLYARSVRALAERGLPEPAVRSYKPWAVVTLLSVPSPVTGQFLDLVLYQMALAQGKPVLALETVEEQLAAFDDLGVAEQVALLEHTLEQREHLAAAHEELLEAYLREDLSALSRISSEIMGSADPALAHKIMQGLIDDRNRIMVRRMGPSLESGGAFVAVGALHLPGATGVLSLLEQEGYRVVPVF